MAASDGIPMFMWCPGMPAPGATINPCSLLDGWAQIVMTKCKEDRRLQESMLPYMLKAVMAVCMRACQRRHMVSPSPSLAQKAQHLSRYGQCPKTSCNTTLEELQATFEMEGQSLWR